MHHKHGEAVTNLNRNLEDRLAFVEEALSNTLAALEHVDHLLLFPKSSSFYDWIDFSSSRVTKPQLKTWHKTYKTKK
jgi:hypothetical protein